MNAGLVSLGADVSVYTTRIDGAGEVAAKSGAPVILDGVKVHYFEPSFPRSWFYSSQFRKALVRTVSSFDIVHITSVFLAASTLGANAASKAKVPFIISPRGSLMKEPLSRRGSFKKRLYISLIEKRNLKRASAIHFTSAAEMDEYAKLGFPLKESIVIPNSFQPETLNASPQTDFRKKYGIPESAKVVLYIGRINFMKGLDRLIESFPEVAKRAPGTKLVIVGGDERGYKAKLDAIVKTKNLASSVIFTGQLVGEEKAAALKSANVFVLPSYSESFGVSLLEAMYFKLPVVTMKEVGLADAVERAGAGVVVGETAPDLVQPISRILGNPELARAMGERGAQLVAKEFSPRTVAEAHLAFYSGVARKTLE